MMSQSSSHQGSRKFGSTSLECCDLEKLGPNWFVAHGIIQAVFVRHHRGHLESCLPKRFALIVIYSGSSFRITLLDRSHELVLIRMDQCLYAKPGSIDRTLAGVD